MDTQPWDRQEGETARLFGYFATYRDIGRARTLSKAAEISSRSERYLQTLSHTYGWKRRVDAFDAERTRERGIRLQAEYEEATDKLAKMARVVTGNLIGWLQTFDMTTLSPKDFATLWELATKHELIALGRPTQSIAVTTKSEQSADTEKPLTEEERRARLAELVAEASRRLAEADSAGGAD